MFNKIPQNDYNSRLHNSVVLYDGRPVNVIVVDHTRFDITPIHTESKDKTISIKPDDPLLDISTPPLGWMNYGNVDNPQGYAVYLERLPVRKWRQGLCHQNSHAFVLSREGLVKRNSRDYIYTKGYENLVDRTYPDLDTAIKFLVNKKISIALNREIGLVMKGETVSVYYKTSEVGYFNLEDRIVHIPKETNSEIISRLLSGIKWVID